MDNNGWYDVFTEILYKKFPKRTQLTKALMALIEVEREAVYRRLRKEVPFSAHEIIKIASAWNISLDEITHINSEQFSFQLRTFNYLNPPEEDAIYLRKIIEATRQADKYPDAEYMCISNKLSRHLYSGFTYLNKFHLLKAVYQYHSEKEILSFSQLTISKEKQQITDGYYKAVKHIPNVGFVWDSRIFEYLVNDVKYFHSIYMITDEEKELIKEDLHRFLDYMHEVANTGCYPETQNNVTLYISQLNINTNYSYMYMPKSSTCYIHVFDKYHMSTFNTEMVENFITWMQLRKRTSIQISVVDERSRIEFFTQQRKIVDTL